MRVGPYELVERIGSGGMAEIYVAQLASSSVQSGRVAIKRILPQLAKDQRFVAMFCDEARICAALSHQNIVRVVDFGEHQGELFIAMEYVEGVSCAKLLRAVAARGQTFPLGAALYVAQQVLHALEYAHAASDERGRTLGLVHRDVSPGNIMVSRAGEVKLTDFGIVRSEFVARRTYPGELKGKIGYMAPEQVVGADVDPRTDLFALGIVLSEMLIARPLFPGPSEMEILTRIYEANLDVLIRYGKELPAPVMQLLRKALARKREERFESATAFLEELGSVASSLNVELDERQLLPWLTALAVMPSGSGVREATRRVLENKRPPTGPEPEGGAVDGIERLMRQPLVPSRSRPAGAPRRSARRRTVPEPQAAGYTLATRHGPVGPLSLSRLLEQVATGRVSPAASVSASEGAAVRLERLPAVSHLLAGSAYRFGTPDASVAAWHQPIERWRFPAVLYRLAARASTGLLVVGRGAMEKRIYWVKGVPRFITSTQSQELFGARLVRAGVITAARLQEVLDAAALSVPRRLGEVLLMRGDIDSSELLRQLVLQLRDRFVEIGSAGEGKLLFFQDLRYEHPMPLCAGPELVTRLIRTHYSASELERLLDDVAEAPVAAAPNRLISIERLGLDADEARVLESAPGAIRMDSLYETLASRYEISAESVRRAVFIGLSAGWIVSPAW